MALPESLTRPIETLEDAKAWIRALIANDMLFHFEDSPSTIGNIGPDGEWVDLWTEEDAEIIENQRDQVYEVFGSECPIGYALDITNPEWRQDENDGVSVSVGQRVALTKEVEHYQVGVFPVGETGIVKSVSEYMIEVLMDRHFETLDEWENVLEIHDGSELNGDEEKPETYLRVLEG